MSKNIAVSSVVILVLCCLAVGVLSGVASAADYPYGPLVTAVYSPVEGGYRLDFTLTAGTYSTDTWGFQRIDCFDLTSPECWDGQVFTRYTYWTTLPMKPVLQPGQSLDGFSTTFAEIPLRLDYFVRQIDYDTYIGTLVPTPVPEPVSFVALTMGLLPLGTIARRRPR